MSTALITGASSGIGAAFARQLAHLGYDLIVVARRRERLEALAEQVETDVQIIVADLTIDSDVQAVETVIVACDDLALLINNAGFGLVTPFDTSRISTQRKMLGLHLETTLRLTYAAIPKMKTKRHGTIINVSSVGAFLPMPFSANYNATKAYLNSFSEALALELAPYGITVQALCPGFTRTEIFDQAEQDSLGIPSFMWMSPDEVATISLHAIAQKRVIVITGLLNQLIVRLVQFPLIRQLAKKLVYQALSKG